MEISKVTLFKIMKQIHVAQSKFDKWYQDIERCMGSVETIYDHCGIDNMVKLTESVCNDNYGFISHYIYDSNWGTTDCHFEDKSGCTYRFHNINDLYDLLQHSQPWNLKFCWGK